MGPQDPVNILLVDDQPGKLLTYEVILNDLGANLIKANSGREALAHLLKTDVALILVDVCMPELDGFQLVRMLREHPRFEKIAVIFISAIHQSEIDLVRGYETGAVDYVPVPVVPEVLRAKVRVFVDLYRKTHQLERLNRDLEARVAERTAELENSTLLLKESEERLRLASEAAEFGTYDYNLAADRLHCSPHLKRLLGTYETGELTLEEFVTFCHPDDRDTVRRSMQTVSREPLERHEIEFRIPLSGGRMRWLLDRGASFARQDASTRVMGTIVDITERKSAEEQQRLLAAELDHRVKNMLGNVAAMARLSSRQVATVDAFVDALDGRIQAMSRAHGLLQAGNWTGACLSELAKVALQPLRSQSGRNIEIRGGKLPLDPKQAQSMAFVLHELATNAVKHGALSQPNGRVTLDWTPVDGTDNWSVVWRESGGPPVVVPRKGGFGLTVLQLAATDMGAQVESNFNQDGLICVITGPFGKGHSSFASQLRKNSSRSQEARSTNMLRASHETTSLRVLLVEDEPLIALFLQSELESAGHQVTGPAYNLKQGLELAGKEAFDVALLDVRLGSDFSVAIADQLLARAIPFAFTTGYSEGVLIPEHLRGVPSLAKPYQSGSVIELLGRLAGKKAVGLGAAAVSQEPVRMSSLG